MAFTTDNEGDWSGAPASVKGFALRDLDYGDMIYVFLPEGWRVDKATNGLDEVIHCPAHTVG
jgi:hypothetical protein